MKKIITAITALIMTVFLSISASAATSPKDPTTPIGGVTAFNQSANDYFTYARPVYSYIEETENGFRRIEYIDGILAVEEYDKNFTRTNLKTTNYPYYIFGGYYQGSDYCYLVWGKENPNESNSQEVLLIEKYTKGLTSKISSVSVYGAYTSIPFSAGSLRMTETDGRLYIHTCHQMYKSASDGLNHQANMTFVVDTSTMAVVDSWYNVMNINYGYVSHSFNQFIETDGSYIYRVDHGDAFPRSVVITKCAVGDRITNVSYTDAFPISGATGDNFTGVSVGGFELSTDSLLIAGNTADQNSAYIGYNSVRNIFITVTDKNLSSTSVKYLTNYTDADSVGVCTPHLVKINDNKFLVMWEELADNTLITRLATIDAQGNLTSGIVDTYMLLSDCAPVLFSDGLVYWFKSDMSGATLYRVNPDDLAAANNSAVDPVENLKLGGRAADALRLNWDINYSADGYIIEMYKDGEWTRIKKITDNTITTYRVTGLTASTEYQFRVKAYSMIKTTALYSEYTDVLKAVTNPFKVAGFKLGGRAADALRLNWTKNTTADGYIVEQYKSGKWVRIAKITSNATTTYRVTGLKASTQYKFRVRAYKMSGKTALYSGYTSTLSAYTNPTKVANLKITGKATTALRLGWSKNTSADGYIIEMYKDGKWVRAAKITSNATVTFRKSGLKKGTTYKFRVRTYNMVGKTALYGNYVSVSGTTNK